MNREKMKSATRDAFIKTTKRIIEEQGVQFVTARNVGKISGYSYASIYNYYEDINDLLVETAVDYINSSHKYMVQYVKPDMDGAEKLYALAKGYVTYLYNHPELFKVMYILDYGNRTIEHSMKMLPRAVFEIRETLEEIGEENLVASVDDTFKLLSSATHGKLMFAILGRDRISLEQILDSIKVEINIILGGKKK